MGVFIQVVITCSAQPLQRSGMLRRRLLMHRLRASKAMLQTGGVDDDCLGYALVGISAGGSAGLVIYRPDQTVCGCVCITRVIVWGSSGS